MKTIVPFTKLICGAVAITMSFFSVNVFAQSGPGSGGNDLLKSGLKFKNPQLETSRYTDLKVGAIYLFEDVAEGIDARLRIDSLVNGAEVKKIDDNSNGLGYKDALQPEVEIGNAGRSYAVFTITFYEANTTTLKSLQTVNATALDIDGNLITKEFAELRMGNGGTASYMGTSLDISLLSFLLGKFRAENILGIERDGIDTSSYGNMFTARNNGISSFSIRYGTNSLIRSNDSRQFSLYMKGFSYPSEITLPVELASFTAILDNNNNRVDLKWTTAMEKNVSHFVVEKSLDGKTYEDAGIVFAYGNTSEKVNYSFPDKNINTSRAGVIYYRLRTVDIDQKIQYSPIRVIRIGKQAGKEITLLTFPNPVTNELRVTIPSTWQDKKVSYEIINNNGRLSIRTESGNSGQTETIDVSRLTRGMYIIRAICEDEIATQTIVKQ